MNEVTLTEMLDAREERVRTRTALQNRHSLPVISFTMNIAGPVKTSPLIERVFTLGLSRLKDALSDKEIKEEIINISKCGPSAQLAVDADAKGLKRIAVAIEESSEVGRLFDIDVYGTDGVALTRDNERGCLVCKRSGRACARSRAHSVEELTRVSTDIMTRTMAELDAALVAALARECLIREVMTSPKPGLVDPEGCGSHSDMTVESFIESADALEPYFYDAVRLGMKTKNDTPDALFTLLRERGLIAEGDMYRATGGVNTHKGVIYSIGIIAGAIGRLWDAESPIASTEDILRCAGEIAKESASRDLNAADGSTAGTRLYLERGIRGIRGEAALGFPSVINIALPAYRSAIELGLDENLSGLMALLALIAETEDTNLYKRGGEDGAKYAKAYAKRLISLDTPPALDDLAAMDKEFVKRNLSPGGCADLLAIAYLMLSLEECKKEFKIK